MAEILGILTGSAAFIIILILGFFWNLLVAYMAAKRGRSSLGVVCALFMYPSAHRDDYPSLHWG